MEIIFMVLPEEIILQDNWASFDAEKKGSSGFNPH